MPWVFFFFFFQTAASQSTFWSLLCHVLFSHSAHGSIGHQLTSAGGGSALNSTVWNLKCKKCFAIRRFQSRRITTAEYEGSLVIMQDVFSSSIFMCAHVFVCACFGVWAVSTLGYAPIYNWHWQSCVRTQQQIRLWKTARERQKENMLAATDEL